MSALRVASVVGVLALSFGLHGVAAAGNWKTIIVGKNETIAIDTASITSAASGATAWSRVTLDREVKDAGGAFDAIHAQNLYDCSSRRFTILRRAYFSGNTLVREDFVSRQRANAVQAGSIDERLFNVACRTASTRDVAVSADTATRAIALEPQDKQGERPAPMHADMRALANNSAAPRLMMAADSMPAAPTEKPKLIVLPPIDKAAADQAAAGTGQKPVVPVKARANGQAADRTLVPTPEATKSNAAKQEADTPADKRLRELHYATSGPRKAAKKKQSAESVAASEQDNSASRMHISWSYEGNNGPGSWAKLRGDYATCDAGKRQSPIDIREGIKVNLEAIKFDYKPTQFRIVDNGHTVQVNVGEGLGLTVMSKRYELIQLHFHRPSEERVNGRVYDMVVHLVHKNGEGQLAVVAVLLEKGTENQLIQTLWNNMPLEQDVEVAPDEAIDLNKLLPESRAYWTYMGSLTAPPCTEGVLWMVLKQPIQVASEQVAIFSRMYRVNARPIQPANGRLVKESR